ncbi:hypothetical protein MTR67_032188 [Solanum verrucosum]|uniref:Uncharacterized protein n=1 Tax=Solanum verrucosum TaxID=315347 RepID=A0AAF0U3Y5_SOLVR|nr:hypothetical protein MTR67_032188 [Solanum verrucosum]
MPDIPNSPFLRVDFETKIVEIIVNALQSCTKTEKETGCLLEMYHGSYTFPISWLGPPQNFSNVCRHDSLSSITGLLKDINLDDIQLKLLVVAAKILANLIVWALLYIGKGFCSNISSGIVHILGLLGCLVCYFLPPCISCTYSILMADASKNGVAQEAVQTIKRAQNHDGTDCWCDRGFIMGRNCAGPSMTTCLSEMLKMGVFTVIQSKVHRAKECLEEVYKPKEPETK